MPIYIKRSTVNVYKIDSSCGQEYGFSKIARLMGRLGSGPYVVGRLGSGMGVSISFQLR